MMVVNGDKIITIISYNRGFILKLIMTIHYCINITEIITK